MRTHAAAYPVAGVFAAACVLYGVSAGAGPGWGDAANQTRLAAVDGLRPVARAYPLQATLQIAAHALGRDPASAAGIAALMLSAASVAVTYAVARHALGLSRVGAAAAAGAMLVCHVNWVSAVEGEVYGGLGLFAALGAGVALARPGPWREWGAGAALGLASLHHRAFLPIGLVAAAVAVVGAGRGARGRALGRSAAGLALGLLPFAALVAAGIARGDIDWSTAAFRSWLVGSPRNAELLLHSELDFGASIAYVARWIAFDMAVPGLVLVPFGVVALRREQRVAGALLLAAGLVIPLRFDGVGDRHVFLAGIYPLLALVAGAGAERVGGRLRAARIAIPAAVIALPIGIYWVAALPSVSRHIVPDLTPAAAADFLFPVRSSASDSRLWSRAVLEPLPPGAELFADWGAAGARRYVQEVEGCRPDVVVHRRLPAAGDVAAAGEQGVVIALTPIHRDPEARLADLGGTIARPGPGTFRVGAAG